MIRCSAFLFSLDEAPILKAREVAERLDRHRERVTVVEDMAGREGQKPRLVALALDRGGELPAVHGWLGENADAGEYCMVAPSPGGVEGRRDAFGTRPLYMSSSGRCVFSDHRLFPLEGRTLVPPGASFRVGSRSETIRQKPEAKGRLTYDEAAEILAALIDTSVRERVGGRGLVAVSFSGGLDSSILAFCAAKYAKVLACTASAPGSPDARHAVQVADMLNLETTVTELSSDLVGSELGALDLPFETTRMDRALWCLYSVSSRAAAEGGARMILLGQLADELFGGYSKYQEALSEGGAPGAEILMEGDVRGCAERGFIRDEAACSRWLEPMFPFADARVADFGLSMPVSFKIREGVRKAVLRRAAGILGLPEALTGAPKKAAQYSSGVLKFIT